MNKNRFPAGWDEERVQRVLHHYEGQTDDEAVAEDEDAFGSSDQATIQVPRELVDSIRRLIAEHQAAQKP